MSSLSVLIFPSRESTSGKWPGTQRYLYSRSDHYLSWRSLLYLLPRIIFLRISSGRISSFLTICQFTPVCINIQLSNFSIPVLPINWAEVSDARWYLKFCFLNCFLQPPLELLDSVVQRTRWTASQYLSSPLPSPFSYTCQIFTQVSALG